MKEIKTSTEKIKELNEQIAILQREINWYRDYSEYVFTYHYNADQNACEYANKTDDL